MTVNVRITYALYVIFLHSIGEDTIFKGGTALSKCFSMIGRFSKDTGAQLLLQAFKLIPQTF